MKKFTSKKYKDFEFSIDDKEYSLPNFKTLTTAELGEFQANPQEFLNSKAGAKLTEQIQDVVLADVLEAWLEFDEEVAKKS